MNTQLQHCGGNLIIYSCTTKNFKFCVSVDDREWIGMQVWLTFAVGFAAMATHINQSPVVEVILPNALSWAEFL